MPLLFACRARRKLARRGQARSARARGWLATQGRDALATKKVETSHWRCRRCSAPPGTASVAKEHVVRVGHQRRPSPPAAMSRGRKSATVVIPVRWAMTEGSPIWRVERIARPPYRPPLRIVPDRLPVRTDQVDRVQRNAALLAQPDHRLREDLAQYVVEMADVDPPSPSPAGTGRECSFAWPGSTETSRTPADRPSGCGYPQWPHRPRRPKSRTSDPPPVGARHASPVPQILRSSCPWGQDYNDRRARRETQLLRTANPRAEPHHGGASKAALECRCR